MRIWFWVVGVAACFAPRPPAGAPCTSTSSCPDPLVCSPATQTCEVSATAVDAGAIDGDAITIRDGSGSAAPDCWQPWRDHTVTLTPPAAIASTVTAAAEIDPVFSEDGLNLGFARRATDFDVFFATRPARDQPFGTPTIVPALAGSGDETRATEFAGGTRIAFASSRAGGVGGSDLWLATLTGSTVGTPTEAPLLTINDATNQFDPELTEDGLHLYYSQSPDTNGASQIILFATRASLGDAFDKPTQVVLAGTPALVSDPAISPDELVLVFTERFDASHADLYYATRTTTAETFTVAGEVPDVDTDFTEGDPDLSSDGCELVFSSNRSGNLDIYLSSVPP